MYILISILPRMRTRSTRPVMYALVGSLCLLSCVTCSWLDGDDGVDRPEGNLPDMPIFLNRTQPASTCAQLCKRNPHCLAWAYSKADCEREASPHCNLKATIPKQAYNPCRVSLTGRARANSLASQTLSERVWLARL